MPSPTDYAWTVNLWIASFFQDFSDRFMQPQYRSAALNIANCWVNEVYAFREYWGTYGIPLEHAAFCYFLTYTMPYEADLNTVYSGTVVNRKFWVVINYHRFKPVLDSYSLSLIPQPIDEDCGPEIEAYIIATTSGAQTVYLGLGVVQFDLYINGLKQNESGCVYTGANLEVNASYEIEIGDEVRVVYRG